MVNAFCYMVVALYSYTRALQNRKFFGYGLFIHLFLVAIRSGLLIHYNDWSGWSTAHRITIIIVTLCIGADIYLAYYDHKRKVIL